MDILGRPFSEPTLIRIAAAYEAATHKRKAAVGVRCGAGRAVN
jgi:Asp-tRNA(Asn)/Glu-tRNA(Gln) amidotransferase A subunit family amidase